MSCSNNARAGHIRDLTVKWPEQEGAGQPAHKKAGSQSQLKQVLAASQLRALPKGSNASMQRLPPGPGAAPARLPPTAAQLRSAQHAACSSPASAADVSADVSAAYGSAAPTQRQSSRKAAAVYGTDSLDDDGAPPPQAVESGDAEPRERKRSRFARQPAGGAFCRRCNMPTADWVLQMGMCPECALEHVLAGMPTSSRRSEAKAAGVSTLAYVLDEADEAEDQAWPPTDGGRPAPSRRGPAAPNTAPTKRARERHAQQTATHVEPHVEPHLHPQAAATHEPSDGLSDGLSDGPSDEPSDDDPSYGPSHPAELATSAADGSPLLEGREGGAGRLRSHPPWRRRGHSMGGPLLSENTIVRAQGTPRPPQTPLCSTLPHPPPLALCPVRIPKIRTRARRVCSPTRGPSSWMRTHTRAQLMLTHRRA